MIDVVLDDGPDHAREALALFPIFVVSMCYNFSMGFLVFITGVAYHGYPTPFTKLVDVLSIIGVCTYANIYTIHQPTTIILSSVAIVFGILNATRHDWRVHVFLVNMPLTIAATLYAQQLATS